MTREEAIEVYNGLINTKIKEAFEFFVPELRESEDERIRKSIMATIEQCPDDFLNPKNRDRMLAYLEKQKEQIPYTDFVIRPHKGDDNNPYDMGVSEAQEYAIKRGFGVPFIDGEVYVDERHIIQTVGNIIRWADEHPKEQKPAEWSEEDEKMLRTIISDGIRGVALDSKQIVWLKSRRPQPRKEQDVEKYPEDNSFEDEWKNYYNNSLVSRRPMNKREVAKHFYWFAKKNAWKPSEEQMAALNALNCHGDLSYVGQQKQLIFLYNDLKKLM